LPPLSALPKQDIQIQEISGFAMAWQLKQQGSQQVSQLAWM
jgi:hypothetical protein